MCDLRKRTCPIRRVVALCMCLLDTRNQHHRFGLHSGILEGHTGCVLPKVAAGTTLLSQYIKRGCASVLEVLWAVLKALGRPHNACAMQVPSFDNKVAMTMIQQELGRPWQDVYSQLTPRPIAAASLGQVCLHSC